jgi:hypothetical protein
MIDEKLSQLIKLTNGLDGITIHFCLDDERFKPLREAVLKGEIWYDGRRRRWIINKKS